MGSTLAISTETPIAYLVKGAMKNTEEANAQERGEQRREISRGPGATESAKSVAALLQLLLINETVMGGRERQPIKKRRTWREGKKNQTPIWRRWTGNTMRQTRGVEIAASTLKYVHSIMYVTTGDQYCLRCEECHHANQYCLCPRCGTYAHKEREACPCQDCGIEHSANQRCEDTCNECGAVRECCELCGECYRGATSCICGQCGTGTHNPEVGCRYSRCDEVHRHGECKFHRCEDCGKDHVACRNCAQCIECETIHTREKEFGLCLGKEEGY
jgi:hypothetical protein